MTDDCQLLRQFTDQDSQAAFSELVRRHVGWVYQASLRRTGERHDLASDVVQQVFIALAKHASAVASHESLAGWLYVTTRYATNHVLRAESRRSKYESVAASLIDVGQTNDGQDWAEIRPLLDQVMDNLSRRDREVLLQHFFRGMSFAEMAASNGVSEDGARKRLNRALEKLRLRLGHRRISSTTAALSAMLGTQASAAAPQAVYALAVAAPWTSTAAAQSSPALGILHLMSTTKATLVGAGLIGIAATVASITFAVREIRADRLADVTATSMMRKIALDEARLRQVMRNSHAGQPSPTVPADMAKEFVPAVSLPQNTPVSPGRSRAAARADGQAFLLQNPAARAMLTDQFRAQAAQRDGLFYRIAGLSPGQIDAFQSHLVRLWLDTLEVTPTGINPGQFELPRAELTSILGSDGFSQWQAFERERVADYFAKNVAMSVKSGADPLTTDQMVQLVKIVGSNSPEFRTGGMVDPATVDWATALAQVENAMSPAQWREAQPWLQKTYVDAQLKAIAGTTP